MTTEKILRRSVPEAQGISSTAILAFVEAADTQLDSLNSFMLLRHGHVVAEGWWSPYAPEYRHELYSLSKSFASTAVGFAVAEGRLTVEDRVISFFPDELPAQVSDNLAAMRVRDLLTMTTGHAQDVLETVLEAGEATWVSTILAQPVAHEPGTYFVYNGAATYLLSAIVQKVAGQTLLDYLQPRLMAPLGMTSATWESSPQGINWGGDGLKVRTEDLAKFGQLYLQQGQWRGQQLMPATWVAEASVCQVDSSRERIGDWAQGYGYQFWRCQHNAYRGDGAGGQYCVVMPDQDAVLAITGAMHVQDMQQPLNLVWQHLLPAMQDHPLPADAAAEAALTTKLASLYIPPVQGAAVSPLAAVVSGLLYAMPANQEHISAVRLQLTSGGATLTLWCNGEEVQVEARHRAWHKPTTMIEPFDPLDRHRRVPAAASGAWTTEDTYTLKLCAYETPFCSTLTLRFAGNQLYYNYKLNVGPEPLERPQLVGRKVS